MQFAHDFRFDHFFELGMKAWANCKWKSDVLRLCAEEARRLDGEVLFRMLASYEKAYAATAAPCQKPPAKSFSSDSSESDSSI